MKLTTQYSNVLSQQNIRLSQNDNINYEKSFPTFTFYQIG